MQPLSQTLYHSWRWAPKLPPSLFFEKLVVKDVVQPEDQHLPELRGGSDLVHRDAIHQFTHVTSSCNAPVDERRLLTHVVHACNAQLKPQLLPGQWRPALRTEPPEPPMPGAKVDERLATSRTASRTASFYASFPDAWRPKRRTCTAAVPPVASDPKEGRPEPSTPSQCFDLAADDEDEQFCPSVSTTASSTEDLQFFDLSAGDVDEELSRFTSW